jgi:hypothetical protein
MGSNKDLLAILGKFSASLKETESRNRLTEKLRNYAETIRKVQGIASNAILTQGNTALFLQLLADSQQSPVQYQDTICTDSGIQHNVLLRFDAGQCSVVSALFPSPFFVVGTMPDELPKDCLLVADFFNVLKVIKVFDGKHMTMGDDKIINKTQPVSNKRRWTHGYRRY